MKPIVTLSLNPAIDIASEADEVRHTHKVRTFGERMEPGGGGINVARALASFGAPVRAIYLAGGPTGQVLDALLERRGIERTAVRIEGDTRTSLNVYERSSGLEYRFVPEGPCASNEEWDACLEAVRLAECDYFVASGSLARCLPDDAYARIAADLSARGVRVVLDTSGAELKAALDQGGIFLVKPSRGELEKLVGRELPSMEEVAGAASQFVRSGAARLMAVTLGRDGAILVGEGAAHFLPAVPVETRSAVGAGDSLVAAMTYGFATGMNEIEAFRLGVAAGAAAVQAPGTDLCRAEDVDQLLQRVEQPRAINC